MEILTTATIPAPEAGTGESENGNYEAVRYNAMKHGVLSKHVVLPHEDKNEFDNILAALSIEYQPSGATEGYLVEELAGIMWRKRRVLLAEGAAINRGLRGVLTNAFANSAQAAVPFAHGLPKKPSDTQDLMTATPEEIAQTEKEVRHDRQCTEKAEAILRKGGNSAYEKALKALLPDSREWWEEYVEGAEYQPDAEGLAEFISDQLLPLCIGMEKEAMYHNAIKAQTVGEGFEAHRLVNLSRYETHLDRKFERTLAMLIKLKELQGKR